MAGLDPDQRKELKERIGADFQSVDAAEGIAYSLNVLQANRDEA